jgi:SAM-dependent methyltransferase
MAIFRIYAGCEPLQVFTMLAVLFLIGAFAAWSPFLWDWIITGNRVGQLQSIVLGGVLCVAAVQTFRLGVLAHLISAHRVVTRRTTSGCGESTSSWACRPPATCPDARTHAQTSARRRRQPTPRARTRGTAVPEMVRQRHRTCPNEPLSDGRPAPGTVVPYDAEMVGDRFARPSLGANSTLRWPLIRVRLDELGPETILELGTGRGDVAVYLTSRATYVGVEPDDTSRGIAESRIDRGSGRIVRDITDLDSGDLFDLVCAFEVLEHIVDDAGVLTQWVEHVRPGGHVLVSVPADPHRFGPWDQLVGHMRRYTVDNLTKLFEAAGLEPIDVRYYGFPAGAVLDVGYNWFGRRRLARSSTPTDLAERTAQSARSVKLPDWLRRANWYLMAPARLVQRRYPDKGVGLVGFARRPA